MSQKTFALTTVGVLVLAGLGTMVSAVNVPERCFQVSRWAVGTAAASGTALCLLVSAAGTGWRRERGSCPTWALVLSSLTLAALVPVSVASCANIDRADGAMLCLAIVAVLFGDSRGGWSTWATSSVLVAVATVLDVTSLCLPAGMLLVALSERRRFAHAVIVAIAAVLGCVVTGVVGWSMLPTVADTTRFLLLQSDVLVLIPVVLLGVGGWCDSCPGPVRRRERTWLTGWTIAGFVGLLAVLAGAPLSVRLLVLPFGWWMPAGLASLSTLVEVGNGWAVPARRLGWVVGLLLMVLAVSSMRTWTDGPLLATFLLTLEP